MKYIYMHIYFFKESGNSKRFTCCETQINYCENKNPKPQLIWKYK